MRRKEHLSLQTWIQHKPFRKKLLTVLCDDCRIYCPRGNSADVLLLSPRLIKASVAWGVPNTGCFKLLRTTPLKRSLGFYISHRVYNSTPHFRHVVFVRSDRRSCPRCWNITFPVLSFFLFRQSVSCNRPLFTAAGFTCHCRADPGGINNINYGPVPFRSLVSCIVHAGWLDGWNTRNRTRPLINHTCVYTTITCPHGCCEKAPIYIIFDHLFLEWISMWVLQHHICLYIHECIEAPGLLMVSVCASTIVQMAVIQPCYRCS